MRLHFYIPKKLLLFVCFMAAGFFSHAVIRYVRTVNPLAAAPYSTWGTAGTDLQAVINYCSPGDEIWIVAGTYKPNRRADALTVITATDRNNAFVLETNVKIYGGFTGAETLLSQRNSATNIVALSGDIGTAGITTDNCYHVVISAGLSGILTLLDGVSVSGGNANASVITPGITVNTYTISPRNGGGMYKVSSNTDITDCRFRRNDAAGSGAGIYETLSAVTSVYSNCTVLQNTSAADGGGLYVLTSGCLFQKCSFTSNDATDDGAGIYLSGSGSPAFTGCIISSNSATSEGGAIYVTGTGSPSFDSCTMNSNTAGSNGGAVSNATTGTLTLTSIIISGNTSGSTGGGVYNNNSPAQLTNCLISGNLATGGGGIWNALSDAIIINCTISGNRSTGQGGGIANGTADPTIQNSIVYGNTGVPSTTNAFYNSGSTPAVDNCLIQGGFTGGGNINANPLFINPIAAASAPTITGDYRVQNCSPVLNAGNNVSVPAGVTTDLDGNNRINYGNVDMGAYEKQLVLAVPNAAGIVYVDIAKTGNGSSWANALPQLADAIAAAKFNTAIQQIWVAKGTYYPRYNSSYRPLACNNPDEFSTFFFSNNLKIYGGFAGGEIDTTGRNFVTNKTTLSGDIGVLGDIADNCNNVVRSINVGSNSEFNGFTVTKGNGVIGSGIEIGYSDLIITNCIFLNNISSNDGGAMFNAYSSPVITNCSFLYNTAASIGGGMFNTNASVVKIYNCVFTGNTASTNGGAIANFTNARIEMYNSRVLSNESGILGGGILLEDNSDPSKFVDCVFSGNESGDVGGGICSHNSSEFINCLISGNKSDAGAGIHFRGAPGLPYRVENCTITGNAGTMQGGALYIAENTAVVRNSIIYGNTGGTIVDGMADIAYSLVQGALYPGTGNINSNPLFISPQLSAAAPTIFGDYHLQKCAASPAIDAGSIGFIPAGITKDLDEQSRVVNAKVDMGAYESHYAYGKDGKIYVDKTKTGKGTSWADAAPELADALREAKYNTGINEIWVAKGTYNPLYNAADNTETFCKIPGSDNAFVLINNVKVYGGFAGGETSLSQRNTIINNTILSGDIGIANDTADNVYNVVIAANNLGTCKIDGVIIENGKCFNGNSSRVVNSRSIDRGYGAGIYFKEASPVFRDCIIRSNYTKRYGGGAYLESQSSPVFVNCSMTGNQGYFGGAVSIQSQSSPEFYNCRITDNIPDNFGNPGAGLYVWSNSGATLNNCTIVNPGVSGAGIYTFSPLTIVNSIVRDYKSVPDNISSVLSSCTYPTLHAGGGNINLNPLFVSLTDYRLQPCSPVINMGNNSLLPVSLTKDLDSLDRIKYTTIDMGAYEMQSIDLANSTWKGVNTNWNDKLNWCGGYIPYDTTNVIIPSSLSNYPTIGSGFTNGVKNILLGSSTSVGVINTGSLSIYGTYTNNGSTINNQGKWVLAGSPASQVFPGTSATVSAMRHLEINNPSGITFNKSFDITGSLIPTNGAIVVNNVIVTLKSSDTATASVDVIQPTASISYTGTGAFIVERFINTGTNAGAGEHTKSWQFLATPTTGQTIYQSWQENGTAPSGFGTWITGTGTGFDVTTAAPSLKYFNEAGISWTAVTNTSNALVNKLGYMLFVRGDRTVTTYNGIPNNTIMRSKGQLFSPTNPASPVAVTANKFQTFGNPYASRIEFKLLFLANPVINNVFYVWDPKLAGSYNLGGYQTITAVANYIPTVGTPPTGNAATAYYPAGVPAPYIESGQAVFVKGNGTGGIINFTEDVKVSGSRLVNKPSGNNGANNRQLLFTTLFTNSGEIADGNIVAFERGFGNNINEHDAVKLMNQGENFGLIRNEIVLAVEAHERVVANDTIFYSMTNLRQQGYQLRFAPVNMRTLGLQPLLIDRYRNTAILLSITDSSYVDFMVTTDIASAAANRFFVVFKRPHKLPIVFTDIKSGAREQGTGIEKGKGISIYPNPVVGEKLHLFFKAMPEGLYEVKLYNSAGQLILNTSLQYKKVNSNSTISLPENMAHGIYQLEIIGTDDTRSVHKISY